MDAVMSSGAAREATHITKPAEGISTNAAHIRLSPIHQTLGQFYGSPEAVSLPRHQFGPGTRDAVTRYQEQIQKWLLTLSGDTGDRWEGVLGVVDTDTAAAINQDYDRFPPPLAVTGLVRDGARRS